MNLSDDIAGYNRLFEYIWIDHITCAIFVLYSWLDTFCMANKNDNNRLRLHSIEFYFNKNIFFSFFSLKIKDSREAHKYHIMST